MAEKMSVLLKREAQSAQAYRERLKDLIRSFRDNRPRFGGITKTYTPFAEGGDEAPPERKEVGATVKEDLAWFKNFFVQAVDAAVQKEATNQHAKADLKLFGHEFKDLPATALLNLEGKLKELKNAVVHMPVLDDAKDWVADDGNRGTFRQNPDEWTYRTEKRPYNHIKAPATDKHAAQVEVLYRDENIGKWTKRIFSGAVSVAKKADLLARIDEAVSAVVKAREEANMVEVAKTDTIAQRIFESIFDGIA